jgi:tRNA threonylcarbamoyladenosine biosynthesis protein TsaB
MTWRLALDTASELGSVAVGRGDNPVATVMLPPRSHARHLVPAMATCLRMLGIGYGDLTEIVLADGPGSFTGLRIGAATVQGVLAAHPCEFWVAPSMMGLAWGAARHADDTVAVLYDALRGDVFAAIYQFADGNVIAHTEPILVSAGELQRCARVRPTVVLGDGARAHADVIEAWAGTRPLGANRSVPRAEYLLPLVGMAGGARRITDATVFEPVYGRAAEAQVRWERQHGRRLPDSSAEA